MKANQFVKSDGLGEEQSTLKRKPTSQPLLEFSAEVSDSMFLAQPRDHERYWYPLESDDELALAPLSAEIERVLTLKVLSIDDGGLSNGESN
jgi:hypothetical protein